MKTIIETFKNFVEFLKNPTEQQDPIQSIQQKRRSFFSLLILDFLVAGIITVIVAIIEKLGLDLTETYFLYMLFEQMPIWLIALSGIIIAPLFEELIFRLPLKFKYNYLLRFIILLSYIAGKENKIKFEIYLKNFWTNHFRWIFYLTAILFGLVHLTNYEFSVIILLFAPILVVSQFFGGLIWGYLRIKYNLMLAFLSHATFNGILLGITLISMLIPTEKLNIENENYSIKIEEASIKQEQHYSSFISNSKDACDTINFEGTSLKTIINTLLEKDEYLTETNNPRTADTKINLTFINHAKNIVESKEIILKHLSNLYNFDIEILKKEQEVWKLVIQDTVKLMKHKTKIQKDSNQNYSRVIESEDKIEFENADLNIIAHKLKENYNKNIINTNDMTDRFDFTIYAKDFNTFINLTKIKGLSMEFSLEKMNQKIEYEYVNVNFKK